MPNSRSYVELSRRDALSVDDLRCRMRFCPRTPADPGMSGARMRYRGDRCLATVRGREGGWMTWGCAGF